jgi:hypothetical protein
MRIEKGPRAIFFVIALAAVSGILALRFTSPAITLAASQGHGIADPRKPVALTCGGAVSQICDLKILDDRGPVAARCTVSGRTIIIQSGLSCGARYRIMVQAKAIFVKRRSACFDLSTCRPARLEKVTVGGVEARNVFSPDSRPEIVLFFSKAMNPGKTHISLRDETAAHGVDLKAQWDDAGDRAAAAPPVALSGRRTYSVVLDAGAEDASGISPETPERWSFHVLGIPAPPPEDRLIIVDRENQQTLLCGQNRAILRTCPCATGIYYPTPGTYRVYEKIPSAKSLFDDSRFSYFVVFQKSETGYMVGFHSIPVFPDGRPAGGLGKPNSHGCVRLSRDAAKDLYEWAQLGTRVIVY